ncbi:uncharacterized protein BXZ73DRAFT_99595 [Epithele typhae]|uniref:uncharacterized protein n=1 Tax=Epithele typhae TaxID=378194 RepID=UPI0020089F7B|nr:uncharacterized protein BXZ73DRAFT_99595 [Epithele typhae]KAH9939392.1 hypothetical protein BXZ73DRAFT_99595 [Epithele typhae]
MQSRSLLAGRESSIFHLFVDIFTLLLASLVYSAAESLSLHIPALMRCSNAAIGTHAAQRSPFSTPPVPVVVLAQTLKVAHGDGSPWADIPHRKDTPHPSRPTSPYHTHEDDASSTSHSRQNLLRTYGRQVVSLELELAEQRAAAAGASTRAQALTDELASTRTTLSAVERAAAAAHARAAAIEARELARDEDMGRLLAAYVQRCMEVDGFRWEAGLPPGEAAEVREMFAHTAGRVAPRATAALAIAREVGQRRRGYGRADGRRKVLSEPSTELPSPLFERARTETRVSSVGPSPPPTGASEKETAFRPPRFPDTPTHTFDSATAASTHSGGSHSPTLVKEASSELEPTKSSLSRKLSMGWARSKVTLSASLRRRPEPLFASL